MTTTDSSRVDPAAGPARPEDAETFRAIGDVPESTLSPPDSLSASTPLPSTPPGPPAAAAYGAEDPPDKKQATRIPEGAWLGGVCTGLARHLGWPVMVVRITFVAMMTFQFIGVIAYGALWLLMPPATTEDAPGLEAASRNGMRDQAPAKRRIDWGMALALGALGIGLIWFMQSSGLGIRSQLFLPVAFACAGAALVWRQADTAQQKRWRAEAGGKAWLAPFVARGGWPALVRVIVGLGLVGAAFGIVIAQQGQISLLPQVMAMTTLALAGLAIVLAPWLYRSRTALNPARAEKVRADARADMAAHLHDSVLQTLALIQRQADDPKAVAAAGAPPGAGAAHLAVRRRAARDHAQGGADRGAPSRSRTSAGIPVELVMVGDCDTSDPVQSLVRAAREAMVNAAKHSGADKIDVYAEVDEERIEVFVRDRGQGFDLDSVAEDRMGVKGSIIDRMARHGGTATVRSTPGDGTEVRLEITR